MPTYTLLGATGSTGSAILRCLLAEPPKDLTLKIFIRSKSKLLAAFPDLEQTTAIEIQIIEGTPNDQNALRLALQDAQAVFQCIASNDSSKPTTLCFDTVTSIIEALRSLRKSQESSYTKPTILQLRSGTLNDAFIEQQSWLSHKFVTFALANAYADIDHGCKTLESAHTETPELLDLVIMDCGAILDASGTERTGHELVVEGPMSPVISYSDLGAGFVEVVERRGEFIGKAVVVSATGKVKQDWGPNISSLAWGLKGRLIG